MRCTDRATRAHVLLALGAVLFLTLAAGCGRATEPPPPMPGVSGVTPAAGPVTGGTLITVTGTSFFPGATVLVGGQPATNVTVLDGGTLTCTTPAGPPGAQAAIQITTPGGMGLLLGAYFYIPPPKITQVGPTVSSIFGGMPHTLQGSGFLDNAAGPNTVTVGGVAATNVVTVTDGVLLFTAPAGAPGAADIVVSNANGTDTDLLAYFIPIMAAQGGGSLGAWNLYAIEPSTGAVYLIGPLAIGITGMDFSPTGTLYGVTAAGSNPRDLVTINPGTGAMTVVGPLDDLTFLNYKVQDITFVGSTLYGSALFDINFFGVQALVTIDTTSGFVNPVGPGIVPFEQGAGFAADLTSTNVYWMGWDFGPLWSVDVLTPSILPGVPLIYPFISGWGIGAATYHLGTLYAVHPVNGDFFSVDTTTGLATVIGPILPSNINALASPNR